MKLFVIRHGESEANAQGIAQGQKIDTPLSEKGRQQAKLVAERLKDEKIEEIYSSDLKRAKETAEAIAQFHNLKIKYDERLREYDSGIFTIKGEEGSLGKYRKEQSEKQGIPEIKVRPPEGESFEDHVKRTREFLSNISHHKGNVIIVAHGGTNRIMLDIFEEDKNEVSSSDQGNTCVNIIEKTPEGYKIELKNCLKHLPEDKKIIEIFEKVQKIHYKVKPYNEEEINENLKEGDCRHKTELLYQFLIKAGYDRTKKKIVIFDWADLPIPREILNILKNSGTKFTHKIIKTKTIHGMHLYIDPSWDSVLEKAGFPITKNWSGLENTKQVTEGKLEFHKPDAFNAKEHGINIDKEEVHKFAEALNNWLEEIRKIPN